MQTIAQQIAQELSVRAPQVETAIHLLDEGSTVPFISRYRKEATGGLSDAQLRQLEERLSYLRDLEKRRETILNSISEQGKLTEALKQEILKADTKSYLEDLYLPYKPKRRTKATIAREAGLEPLASRLLSQPTLVLAQTAQPFVNPEKGVPDVDSALEGASHILVERFSEDAELLKQLRQRLWQQGVVVSKVAKGKTEEGAKFSDYFDYSEPIRTIPSHRALALFRGEKEGFLKVSLKPGSLDANEKVLQADFESRIAGRFGVREQKRPADAWLLEAVHQSWKSKIFPHLETELMGRLRESAEEEAIRVFAKNLHDLLLAAPAGSRVTMGLDPGLRTGVKVAVVDGTGKLLDTATIYPHPPANQWEASLEALTRLVRTHHVDLISIGNGTASRETDRLAVDLLKRLGDKNIQKKVVSEAGASVYSATELAEGELPGLDVSLRGAVSIARRLQDPLAELVKIEPKAIGVGQYQHDVNQTQLDRMLDAVVQDCVNAVGVDVNSASVSLLTYISGLSKGLAKSIVDYRNTHGAFPTRQKLKKVPRFGEKAFEQAAGFLRIANGENPLDASAVHPEAYLVVQRILKAHGKEICTVIGDSGFLRTLKPEDYVDPQFGIPTVRDILSELEKPGRDPRPAFQTATFQEGVETMKDLKPGMLLEGVVTNVTNFGAFVDIGVHQDGLVHISNLADTFVKDPHAIVKAGDVVKVKVMEVDLPRKRIGLTMRLSDSVRA